MQPNKCKCGTTNETSNLTKVLYSIYCSTALLITNIALLTQSGQSFAVLAQDSWEDNLLLFSLLIL